MFDLCTYNAGNATKDRVERDLSRLARRYQVVGLQEVADQKKAMNATGAQVLTGDGNGEGKVALLVAPGVPIVATGYVPCTKRTFVGRWGAGPADTDAKGIRWATVVLDGAPVTVGSTHLVSSVQRPIRGGGPLARIGRARRRALYKKHVAAIVKWVESVDGPLDLVGDFNAVPEFDLLDPLRAAGLACASAPSHGKAGEDRDIDHHWSRGLDQVAAAEALEGYSSDHKPVTTTYEHQGEPVPTRKPDYPKADAEIQWFADNPRLAGSTIDPNVVVLHTTESLSWPSYNNGGTPGDSAPHYTAKPDIKACNTAWRQHYPESMSSRALRNEAGGVETNTLNCVQVELIGTCDAAKAKTWMVSGVSLRAGVDYIYWPDAPEWALRELADFLASIHKRRGIKLEAPKLWLAYGKDERAPGRVPASYGDSPARMTFAQWRGFYGVCGHQHVPENVHGDPGRLNIARVLELAGVKPTPKPGLAARLRVTLTKALAVAEANGNSARAAWLRAALAALPGK